MYSICLQWTVIDDDDVLYAAFVHKEMDRLDWIETDRIGLPKFVHVFVCIFELKRDRIENP